MNDAGVPLLTSSKRKVMNTKSTDGLDSAPNCRVCLAQSHRASKGQIIQPQLLIKFVQNPEEKLRTLLRFKPSLYRPKYGHSCPPSPYHKFLTPTMMPSNTAHKWGPKGRAKGALTHLVRAQSQSQTVPGWTPSST